MICSDISCMRILLSLFTYIINAQSCFRNTFPTLYIVLIYKSSCQWLWIRAPNPPLEEGSPPIWEPVPRYALISQRGIMVAPVLDG